MVEYLLLLQNRFHGFCLSKWILQSVHFEQETAFEGNHYYYPFDFSGLAVDGGRIVHVTFDNNFL